MTEAELLQIISAAVSGVVADPILDPTTPIEDVTNMQQKVFITDLTKTPR